MNCEEINMTQEFFIQTIPQGQARARFARVGSFVKTYDPKQSKDYKSDIRYQVMYTNHTLMEGPLTLILEFYMPRPKSHFNKKGLKQLAPSWHQVKPDLDNLVKAVKDSVRGLLYNDDSQVCNLLAQKKYGDFTGIKITLKEAV
jgi:Holliday junction resolvase RusA-like endonuclease